MKLFNFVAKNCINCYKCVRNCHVKAMRVNQGKIEIDEDKCIACGQCFVVCPKNAHNAENDVELVSDALKLAGTKVAVIDSAYLGIYENPGQFISALKKLGFDSVQEIAAGAEAIKDEYIKYISTHPEKKYMISSTCPSVYMFIMKYYPAIAQYLIPVVTPVLALGKAIEKESPGSFIVYIGPCLSKKYETVKMNEHSPLNALLTFDEIQRLLLWREVEDEVS